MNNEEQEFLPILEGKTADTGSWSAVGWVVLFVLVLITPAIVITAYRIAL